MLRLRKKFNVVLLLPLLLGFIGLGCSSSSGPDEQEMKDTTPPAIMTAVSTSVDRVEVVFDEAIESGSAENPDYYVLVEEAASPSSGAAGKKSWRRPRTASVGDTIRTRSASLQADGRTVVLTTDEMDAFAPYRLYTGGQLDMAGNRVESASKPVEIKIKSGRVFTIAGTGTPARGLEDVDPLESDLYLPQDLTFGPDGLPYILDWNNHRVRVIENGLIRTILGTGTLGDALPGTALEVGLNHPTHVAFGPDGNLYLSAWHNSKVLRLNMSTRFCDVFCAESGRRAFGGDGGLAIDAIVNLPVCTGFDREGRFYIADQANWRIRRVTLDGIIDTWAGTGLNSYCGDGGPAKDACFSAPSGQSAAPSSRFEFDGDGNLYIADTGNARVRRIDTSGIITTVAGTGSRGFSGDGGAATAAELNYPADVAISPDGDLYIADRFNHCVRKVDQAGIITTVAGMGGSSGFYGDGGRATEALFKEPFGITFDSEGNLYIADTKNHRIRVVYK